MAVKALALRICSCYILHCTHLLIYRQKPVKFAGQKTPILPSIDVFHYFLRSRSTAETRKKQDWETIKQHNLTVM